MTLRQVGTLVLAGALAIGAPASALAGNGNGKDDGNGNSANAPGQVKKEEAAARGQAQAAQAQAPAQVQASATGSQPAAAAPQSGVKPSNDSAHDTYAAASSDKTKAYGNGKTAGQIALQNGAAPTTTLHGPGNSQPHKAAPCSSGHEVDVHALREKRSGACGPPTPGPTPQPTPGADPGPGPSQLQPASSSPAASAPSGPPSGAAVLGGGTPKSKPKADRSDGHPRIARAGLLGWTGAVARPRTLPFTGLDLWSAVFVGVMLILIGLALCRRAATMPALESEQEAGP